MKEFIAELKRAPRWAIFRELFFIVLFIISVFGLLATSFAKTNESYSIDDVKQASKIDIFMKGLLGGDEIVERGPRMEFAPVTQGASVKQDGNYSITVTFAENVGSMTIEIYDVYDNIMFQDFLFTRYEKSLTINISTFPPGTYYLQCTNGEGGTTVAKFEIV